MLFSPVANMLRLRHYFGCRTLLAAVVTVALLCGTLLMGRTLSNTATRQFLPLAPNLTSMAPGTCTPRTNIAFLKSHKCASSSIQNILFRYGYKHNLHFALPKEKNYFGGGLRSFRAEMVRLSLLNKLQPNIFAVHTKWNHDEVKKVMPEDTFYFTIVREPSAAFQSLFVFYDLEGYEGMTMDDYVWKKSVNTERRLSCIGYNQMTWDFGMPQKSMNNLTAVREMVARAEDQFGLVLVAERMEESLVLLAEHLCWKLSDVLVLRLNSLRNEFKRRLSPAMRQLLRQKLGPDYLLYRHFTAKFEQQVEAFGRRKMATAVAQLREQKAQLMDTCGFVRKEATKLDGMQRPWSDKVDGFGSVGGEECSLYSLPELPFIERLRKKQLKEIEERFLVR